MIKLGRYSWGWVLLVVLGLFWASCRGGGGSATPSIEIALPESMDILDTLPSQEPSQGFMKGWEKHQKRQKSFETFTAKAKMKYRGAGQRHEFSAQFKMRREEAIWVSISALGGMVSVGRAYLSPDSIKFISYLQRKAWALPLEQAAGLLPFPIDFQMVENLILGQALGDSAKVEKEEIRGPYFMISRQGEGLHFQDLYDRQTLNLRQGLQQRSDYPFRSKIELHDYKSLGRRWFSHGRAWTFVEGSEVHSLEMVFSQPQFDESIQFSFSIPSGFELNP